VTVCVTLKQLVSDCTDIDDIANRNSAVNLAVQILLFVHICLSDMPTDEV
jgi:hypothetical protein